MRRPTLREFLAQECGAALTQVYYATWREDLIREWSIGMGPTEGQLPGASGKAFAEWLSNGWPDWSADPEISIPEILKKAVAEWCGGRSS